MNYIFYSLFFFVAIVGEWKLNADSIEVDSLGNVFSYENSKLVFHSPQGDAIFEFSDKSLGNISQVDLRNSLKPVLFYEGSHKLVVLDNTLSVNGEIVDLLKLNFGLPKMIAVSNDDNIWIYDGLGMNLIKVDKSFNVILQTVSLNQLCGEYVEPIQMIDRDNTLHVLDTDGDLWSFDQFGTLIKKSRNMNSKYVFPSSDGFISHDKSGAVLKWSVNNLKIDTLISQVPENAVIRYSNQKVIQFFDSEIKTYRQSEY